MFMTLIELAHIAIVVLSLQIIGFKPRSVTLLLLMLFSLFFYFFTRPLIHSNPSSIAALFIVLCLFFLSKEQDFLAGIFLSLATFKPQLTLLFFILVWLWAFSNKRWKVLFASAGGVAVLMGISFLLLPEWFSSFLGQMGTYTQNATPSNPALILAAWFPRGAQWLSRGISLICLIILSLEWCKVWKKGFAQFFWTVCLTFSLLPISGITSAQSNFIAFLPAFVLIIAVLEERLMGQKFWIDLSIIVLLISSWGLNYVERNMTFGDVRLYFIGFLLTPLALLAALYWVRSNALRITPMPQRDI
jgi:Gpi18-like mannosyltransferase